MNSVTNTLSTIIKLFFHDYGGHYLTAQLARDIARRVYRTTFVSFTEFAAPKGRVGGYGIDPPGFGARGPSIRQAFDKENLIKRSRRQVASAKLAVQKVLVDHRYLVKFAAQITGAELTMPLARTARDFTTAKSRTLRFQNVAVRRMACFSQSEELIVAVEI